MSLHHIKQLKPFLSLLFIISTLFILAFFHIEERRLGYSILKVRKEYQRAREEVKKLEFKIAKYTRPQNLDHIAQNQLQLKKTESSQVIYFTDENNEN